MIQQLIGSRKNFLIFLIQVNSEKFYLLDVFYLLVVIIAIINYAFDSTSTAPVQSPANKDRANHTEKGMKADVSGKEDAQDEWQENEPIEMQPLVKAKEAANRRSKVPV